jgi:large subunit ribosomal protein L1
MLELSKERKFVESIEAVVRLAVDPRQGDQNIRGTCILPAGTGKEIRICVFADKEMKDEIIAAGADVFGDEEVIKQIGEGNINFDKLITTPD